MSDQEGNKNNPYSFDDFLFVRNNFNYYRDDEFFQALVKKYTGEEFEKVNAELEKLSDIVSFKWRDLSDEANKIENHVRDTLVQYYDAFNHRIDRINRCHETVALEREIFDQGLFNPKKNTPWSRFTKLFLSYENSEFGVMCPMACTHGMIWLMQKYENTKLGLDPEVKAILDSAREGIGGNVDGEYAIGAQFVTEIQGGSDVPNNLVEAVYEEQEGPDGVSNCWRLYGKKFFCSAMECDYAVVTAKPKGVPSSTKIALFVVPSWLPGNKEKEIRNSYTIDRLKPKLGTAELPTAELTYNGAVAYPIGPMEKGLSNVVGVVLTISRLHVAWGLAAGALRVAREATLYAQFREAFSVSAANFPLMMNQINDVNKYAMRAAAGVFKLASEFIDLGENLIAGFSDLNKIEDLEERKRRYRLRELILLEKISVADEAPEMTRRAISFFGGHGIMEDFSTLPRFLRDALIMELWEGPRNVLLTQIHRDFSKVKEWYPADEFCRDMLKCADSKIVEPLAKEFLRLMSYPTLLRNDEETLKICRDWADFSNTLFHAYQEQALKELNWSEKPLKFSHLLREFKKQQKAA